MSQSGDFPKQDAFADSRVTNDAEGAENRDVHACDTPEGDSQDSMPSYLSYLAEPDIIRQHRVTDSYHITDATHTKFDHATPVTLSGHSSAPNLSSLRYPSFNRHDMLQNRNLQSRSGAENSPESQSSLRDDNDSISSRIPRVAALRQAAITSAAKANRGGSSIPIAVKRHSAEQLGSNAQGRQSDPSPSGIRLVEKPRGPRPRPHTEQTAFTIPESSQGVEKMPEPYPPSESPSSVSSWDLCKADETERPATVFTGEYRTRILGIPGHHSPRSTLRIASSAENLIMGASPESSSHTDTHKTNPSLRQRLSRLAPGAPKETNSPKGTTSGTGEILGSKSSASGKQDDTPTSRNFCRPQTSLDAIAKRDISDKEMSISRKSVSSRPSVHNLFSPSLKSMRTDKEPNVPKIPDQYNSGQCDCVRRILAIDPATPATAGSETKDAPSTSGPEVTLMPKTAIKVGPMNLHPPRTSSLQALSELANGSGSERSPAAVSGRDSSNGTKGIKRNITFNNLTPRAWENERFSMSPDKFRLSESKGNNLFGSFRNIFRSRNGASDKDRIKTTENHAPTPSTEIQTPNGEGLAAKDDQPYNDSDKSHKLKSKHTRVSSGVSWNRSRNPRPVTESPATPTPSDPRLLATPHRLPNGNIPSFARPTRSTRTKASPSLKGQTSVTPDAQARRPQVRTASTGSPQRLTRNPRRTTGSVLILPSQKEENHSTKADSEKVAGAMDEPIDSVPKNLDVFRSCLETLCRKIGEAPTLLERDRHARLALRLQQQLGDYQSIEKAALEAESLAKEKLLEKRAAEESLNTSLEEAQAQLKEG